MLGRTFTWIRRFFELAGAIQVLGSLGGATVLAIAIPAILGAVLTLPTALLVVLGVGVFFVALAAILAILKAVLERKDSSKTKFQRISAELEEAQQEIEDLRRENEELITDSENRPSPLPDTLAEWLKTTPLVTVPNQTYRNDRIELDGFHYERCMFEDCTFSFRGTKPFRVAESCRVKGVVNIDARGPQAQAMLVFMKQLGALHPNSQWYDFYDGRLIED